MLQGVGNYIYVTYIIGLQFKEMLVKDQHLFFTPIQNLRPTIHTALQLAHRGKLLGDTFILLCPPKDIYQPFYQAIQRQD